MEGGVAGPETERAKEYQFTAKEKTKPNQNHKQTKTQPNKTKTTNKTHTQNHNKENKINSDKLCSPLRKRTAQYTLGLPLQHQNTTRTHRGHVDVMWVAWAVVSAGSSFGSFRFSWRRKRRYKFGDVQRTFTIKQKFYIFLAIKRY